MTTMTNYKTGLSAALVVAVGSHGIVGCSTTPDTNTVTVMAAASMTDVVDDLFDAYAQTFPDGVTPPNRKIITGGTSTLYTQIEHGGPADLFIIAGDLYLDRGRRANVIAQADKIATTDMAIAVTADAVPRVRTINDLARDDVNVALCEAQVPCGQSADAVLAAAHLTVIPRTRERDVRATLRRVQRGEVDAAIVYRSELTGQPAASRLDPKQPALVSIPSDINVDVPYYLAQVGRRGDDPTHDQLVADFTAFVSTPQARVVLQRHGFTTL